MVGKTKKNDAGFVCAFWTARPELRLYTRDLILTTSGAKPKGRGRSGAAPVRVSPAKKPARKSHARLGFFGALLAVAAASSHTLAPPALTLDSADEYVPQGAGFGVDGPARAEPVEERVNIPTYRCT